MVLVCASTRLSPGGTWLLGSPAVMPALATSTRSAALTSTQLCPMASLGSLPVWCSVTVISLQVAGALSSLLSYCMRSLPLISSLQESAAAWAWVPSASAPSIVAAIVLRIRLIVSSFIGQDYLYGAGLPAAPFSPALPDAGASAGSWSLTAGTASSADTDDAGSRTRRAPPRGIRTGSASSCPDRC